MKTVIAMPDLSRPHTYTKNKKRTRASCRAQRRDGQATSNSGPASVFIFLRMRLRPAISISSRATRSARSPGCSRSAAVHLRGLGEGDADLLAVPPDDVDAERLLLLRDVEIEHVRRRHRIGKDQPRAIGRDIADQAIDRVAAIVEVDHAAQKALLARDPAAFDGAAFGLARTWRRA